MSRCFHLLPVLCGLLAGPGCQSLDVGSAPAAASNPLVVRANNGEYVWERAVDVLHEYHFEIAQETQQLQFGGEGRIETEYRVGSGLLEPWHPDSVGYERRLESTLQSIRRKVFVRMTPVDGGFLVSVEAFQEIEDVQGSAANTPGYATFQESTPLQRDLNLVVGQSRPSGWIPQGRDPALEQSLLASLQEALSR